MERSERGVLHCVHRPNRAFCRLGDLATHVGWKHDALVQVSWSCVPCVSHGSCVCVPHSNSLSKRERAKQSCMRLCVFGSDWCCQCGVSPCRACCDVVGTVLWSQRLEANRKTRADAFYQKKKEATRLRAAAAKAVDA